MEKNIDRKVPNGIQEAVASFLEHYSDIFEAQCMDKSDIFDESMMERYPEYASVASEFSNSSSTKST